MPVQGSSLEVTRSIVWRCSKLQVQDVGALPEEFVPRGFRAQKSNTATGSQFRKESSISCSITSFFLLNVALAVVDESWQELTAEEEVEEEACPPQQTRQ
eukprot:4130110-Amphidinium_carterae.1